MTGPVRATFPVEGHVELREVARLFAVDPALIRRRLHAQGRCLYAHPADRRLRLVAEADIRAIFRLAPAPRRSRGDVVGEG